MNKVILLLLFSGVLSINAQEILIKDKNLKNALTELFDANKNGELDLEEIHSVTALNLFKKEIKHLDGIQQFENLKSINLTSNEISDFSILNHLTNLEEVAIGGNKGTAILNLKDLKKLKKLYAFENGIQQLILGSDQITQIYIQDNLISELNTENFPELHSLNLNNCTNLSQLDISKNSKLVQLFLIKSGIKTIDTTQNLLLKTLYIEPSVKLIQNKNQNFSRQLPPVAAE